MCLDMNDRNLAIGICTYKRTDQLAGCLQSLSAMDLPDTIPLCVIVVDNDPAGSALEVVNEFKAAVCFPVYYRVEARPGIPCARNCVLREAKTLGITDLAFIDDDEYVDAQWLVTLWHQYVGSDVAVMGGYVAIVYPPETPQWIRSGNFFQHPKRQTDTPLTSVASGNVIFDFRKLVVQWNLSFDERFALAGGSDTDFFFRASKKGAVIKWTEDAIAYELLAEERMCLSYLLKNRFRKSNLKLGYADLSRAQKTKLFFGLLKKIVYCLCILPFSAIRGVSSFVSVLNRMVAAIANIMALTGFRIRWNEYNNATMKNGKKIQT